MKIWIIDHYSVPVKYYPLARNTNFAKNLIKMGHEVIIFAASTVHNSDINLIEDGSKYKEIVDDGVKYVLIYCHQYSGNGIKRILNMYEFAGKLETVCGHYPRPDAIVSTSMTLQACRKGIQIARKYGCKTIAQITDLWPESIIAYGMAKENNPVIRYLRKIEKWIYVNAEVLIFSMEGAYEYILKQGWEKEIPRGKVKLINNGVDLEQFIYNRDHYQIDDPDLVELSVFKVIYTGSIRKANRVDLLLDAAKKLEGKEIKLLVWGRGEELEELEKRQKNENISNVIFKKAVKKEEIPYIISNADILFLDPFDDAISKYGISSNKLFEYFAAGKPILTDNKSEYNPAQKEECGIYYEKTAEGIAKSILLCFNDFCNDKKRYHALCEKSYKAAKDYSNWTLTEKLLQTMIS